MKKKYIKTTNYINNFLDKIFISNKNSSSFKKISSSLISIFLGLSIASIFIYQSGANPLKAYKIIFTDGFLENTWRTTLIYASAYAMFGLSVAFSFKTGLFNIGGSGQMLLGGGVAIYAMFLNKNVSTGMFFACLLISLLLGFLMASFAGALKSFFNVHEVVSTILLNWVAFYIVQQLFNVGTNYYSGFGGPSSKSIASIGEIPKFIIDNAWIIAISIALITTLIIAFTLKFTVFGFNLKIVGQSQNVAKYSGINVKLKMMISLGISGAIAGLGGGLLYLLQFKSVSPMSAVPTYGFDGIVIALLAFNAPVGIIMSSIFYGILQTTQFSLQANLQIGEEVYQIIVGIIIYFAAISSIFMKNDFFRKTRKKLILYQNKEYWLFRKNYYNSIKQIIKQFFIKRKEANLLISKNNEKIKSIRNKYILDKRELKKKYKKKIDGESILKYDFKIKELKNKKDSQIAALGYFLKKDSMIFLKTSLITNRKSFILEVNKYFEKRSIIFNDMRKMIKNINNKYLKSGTEYDKKEDIESIRKKDINQIKDKAKNSIKKIKFQGGK